MRLPFGIHAIDDIYSADNNAGMPDGSYVKAVHVPYPGARLRAAWWVLTGRAYAFRWPYHGDLERTIYAPQKPALSAILPTDLADKGDVDWFASGWVSSLETGSLIPVVNGDGCDVCCL